MDDSISVNELNIDWAYLNERAITANVQDVLTETKNTVADLTKEHQEECILPK